MAGVAIERFLLGTRRGLRAPARKPARSFLSWPQPPYWDYAQRLIGTKGKKDGLYWPAVPYHGCNFKVLTKQGANPPNGKYDYVINGNMIAGFALVAWLADYGSSGVTIRKTVIMLDALKPVACGPVSNSWDERSIAMNKILFALPLLLVFCAASSFAAEDDTLKGKVTCAKCDLKLSDKCATVVVVKENGKDVVYYFDAVADKKDHKAICQTPKEGSVTGEKGMDGDKHTIKVSKVVYNP